MAWFHYKLESHFTSVESFAMVHEHFKANLGPGSNNSFIPLYHANFIAPCDFNTKPDEMRGFSLSVLILFFPPPYFCGVCLSQSAIQQQQTK